MTDEEAAELERIIDAFGVGLSEMAYEQGEPFRLQDIDRAAWRAALCENPATLHAARKMLAAYEFVRQQKGRRHG